MKCEALYPFFFFFFFFFRNHFQNLCSFQGFQIKFWIDRNVGENFIFPDGAPDVYEAGKFNSKMPITALSSNGVFFDLTCYITLSLKKKIKIQVERFAPKKKTKCNMKIEKIIEKDLTREEKKKAHRTLTNRRVIFLRDVYYTFISFKDLRCSILLWKQKKAHYKKRHCDEEIWVSRIVEWNQNEKRKSLCQL